MNFFFSASASVQLMAGKMATRDSRSEIAKVFRLFDEDQTGKISFANLKRVIEMVGEKIPDSEIHEMINEVSYLLVGEHLDLTFNHFDHGVPPSSISSVRYFMLSTFDSDAPARLHDYDVTCSRRPPLLRRTATRMARSASTSSSG